LTEGAHKGFTVNGRFERSLCLLLAGFSRVVLCSPRSFSGRLRLVLTLDGPSRRRSRSPTTSRNERWSKRSALSSGLQCRVHIPSVGPRNARLRPGAIDESRIAPQVATERSLVVERQEVYLGDRRNVTTLPVPELSTWAMLRHPLAGIGGYAGYRGARALCVAQSRNFSGPRRVDRRLDAFQPRQTDSNAEVGSVSPSMTSK
jgi:hypothetical protein